MKNLSLVAIVLVAMLVSCEKEQKHSEKFEPKRAKSRYEELLESEQYLEADSCIQPGDYRWHVRRAISNMGGIGITPRLPYKRREGVYTYLLLDGSYMELVIKVAQSCKPCSLTMRYGSDTCEYIDSIFLGPAGKWSRQFYSCKRLPETKPVDSVVLADHVPQIETTDCSISVGDDFMMVMQILKHLQAREIASSVVAVPKQPAPAGSFLDLRYFELPDNTCIRILGEHSPMKDSSRVFLSSFSLGKRGEGYKKTYERNLRFRKLDIRGYLQRRPDAVVADTVPAPKQGSVSEAIEKWRRENGRASKTKSNSRSKATMK